MHLHMIGEVCGVPIWGGPRMTCVSEHGGVPMFALSHSGVKRFVMPQLT
jgi:hypothetical protein